MNAKKIMGAVLVALLAAALFVGAGAAAPTIADGTTIFFYQKVSGADGTWNNGDASFTLGSGIEYVSDLSLPEGKYVYNDSLAIYLKKPTATIVAGTTQYSILGGTVYQGAGTVMINATSLVSTAKIENITITGPNGIPVKVDSIDSNKATNNGTINVDTNFAAGEYKIQVVFEKDGTIMVSQTPDELLTTAVLGTFTVAKKGDVTISATAESFTQGDKFAVTIIGEPLANLNLTATNLVIDDLGSFAANGGNNITLSNTGKATIYVSAGNTNGNAKLVVKEWTSATEVGDTVATLNVKVIAGTITAVTDKESYYIGNDVTLSGTSTATGNLNIFIEGTNLPITRLETGVAVSNGEWEQEIEGADLTKLNLDAGSYSIYVSTESVADNIKKQGTYTTTILVLKQPFISVTDAPAVAVKDTTYKVTGTAEATDDVHFYIFGTNYFNQSTAAVDAGVFEAEWEIEYMDAGQYFMVIQHPMYDGAYNITIDNGEVKLQPQGTVLFNVTDRQKTNAAQALCDALDTQNIDDMYVKLSFVVAAPTSTINPIPTEITKGSKLTVSGTSNLAEGEMVVVEMIATAFAAQPKETVGSASFIALTTKTNEDGSWEITFDTSSLNVDEYTITAAVGTLDKATAKINVIEGAPTEQPTENPTEQPTQTQQPTEAPATPGFGALAALAGLGAVAVLLLRRE